MRSACAARALSAAVDIGRDDTSRGTVKILQKNKVDLNDTKLTAIYCMKNGP
jgi:hypothetical protein